MTGATGISRAIAWFLALLSGLVLAGLLALKAAGYGVLFNPLRIRTQEFIDRRFNRAKYHAEKTLARFSSAARDEVDSEVLAQAMLQAVSETVQPERATLWLKGKKE